MIKKLLFTVALFVTTISIGQATLDVKINGKTVDDFLASTNPVNTFPSGVALDFEVTYTNLPVAPGNTQPTGEQARIVIRFYEPGSVPAVFKNSLYKNGFKELDSNPITETFQYTPTVDHAGHTLQIFVAGAIGDTQIERYDISVDAASTLRVKNYELLKIGIYPNPATNTLTIRDKDQEIKNVRIFDVTGKQVLKTENKTTVDVSTLTKGVYLIKTDNGKLAKFIKE